MPLFAAASGAGISAGLLFRVRDTPDVDLWLHLRIGDVLRAGERFGPGPDPLAALADRPYVPTQWMSQVGMSALHEAFGMPGIQVVRLLLVLALGAAVLGACRAAAPPTPALFAAAVTMFAASGAWGERPQLVGMVLLATTVALWWDASQRGSAPWAIIPLTWVWAMLHGSWPLGIAVGLVLVLGGYLDNCWRGQKLLHAAAVPSLSLVAALLTPLGVLTLLEPFRVSPVARLTANEWQAPTLDNPLLLVVLASSVLSALGLVRSTRRRWTGALTVIVGLAMAMWMVRTIAVGAIMLAPLVAHGVTRLLSRPLRPRQTEGSSVPLTRSEPGATPREWPAWILAAVLVLLLGGSHLTTTRFDAPVSDRLSSALAALPREAVLAVDGRAVGWVQWAHRDRRPLRDLRAEVYSLPVATAYEHFQEAQPGWQDYAQSQEINAVLADRRRPLDQALAGEPTWTAAAEDSDFRLWVRE